MKCKTFNVLTYLALISIWVFSVLSIPVIDETCIVCGQQEGANEAECLRRLSIIEWALDVSPDLHWSCSGSYDSKIHNPNGGIK